LLGFDIEDEDLRKGVDLDDVVPFRRKLARGALVDVPTLAPAKLANEHMPLTLLDHKATLAFDSSRPRARA
jgi:hypothetical protein